MIFGSMILIHCKNMDSSNNYNLLHLNASTCFFWRRLWLLFCMTCRLQLSSVYYATANWNTYALPCYLNEKCRWYLIGRSHPVPEHSSPLMINTFTVSITIFSRFFHNTFMKKFKLFNITFLYSLIIQIVHYFTWVFKCCKNS